MSRQQQSQQGQLDTVEEDAREQEAEHGLPPVVQARVMRLGPADDEALRVLLREWPAYTHAILQVAAHQMGNIAVIRALETPKADGATKPQAITGYKPPIGHGDIHKFIDDPSDQPKVAPPEAAATDAGATTGDAAAATTKVLTIPGEPAWFAGARTYNLAHPELVEQFNAATDNTFVRADGTLDLQGIWSWQARHGLVHDGKIGPHTSDAAKALKTKVEDPKPKLEDPKLEDPKPKIEDTKPKIEEPKPKIEDAKPKVEDHKPKLEDHKPKLEDHKPKLEDHKPKVEDHKSRLEDGDTIAAIAAGLPSPTISKIVEDLRTLATDGTKKKDWQGELGAKDRDKVIEDVAMIRGDLAKINPAGLDQAKLGKFVALVNRQLLELSPYHYQGLNIMTIETDIDGKGHYFSTCNMTSLAMSLELLGKSAKHYTGDKKPHLLVAAQHYKGDLVRKERGAAHAEGDRSGSEASLMGLRLPDFLELCAVAEYMTAPTEAAAIAGGAEAARSKTDPGLLLRLARHFGVNGKMMHVDWNAGETTKLKGVDSALAGMDTRLSVENLERQRARAAAGDKKAAALYEKAQKEVNLHAHQIDTKLPLDRYRKAALAQLRPILDSGAAVMAGCWAHWTRLISVNDEQVKVQDPGSWDRHEMAFSWEEARAMGYFWQNVVFTP